MMASTHRLGGLASGTLMAALLGTDAMGSGILVTAAVLGSLVPDIDNRHSSISRKWKSMSLLVSIGQGGIRLLSELLPKKQRNYVRSLVGHRGITHSLVPAVLVGMVMLICKAGGVRQEMTNATGAVSVGILSHLFFDMLAGGVPLFMPFSTKRVCLAHIKTGGIAEWIFRVGLMVLFLYIGIMEVIPWLK